MSAEVPQASGVVRVQLCWTETTEEHGPSQARERPQGVGDPGVSVTDGWRYRDSEGTT